MDDDDPDQVVNFEEDAEIAGVARSERLQRPMERLRNASLVRVRSNAF